MKKPPSKVAHNRPPIFFLCTGLTAQMAQKQISRTTKSPLLQDWVFRLGDNVQLLPVRKDFPFFGNLRHINDYE